jgi:hypothetical protein
MSTPYRPPPAQLYLSVLGAEPERLWLELEHALCTRLGPMDYRSEPFAFDHTEYYDKELGTPVLRRVLGFADCVAQSALPDIKLWTNALEDRFRREDGSRRVNLDPGLLDLRRLVLASGKHYIHRIYLGRGIWAELTLLYRHGWQPLPWTFQDYADPELQKHLTRMRGLYKAKRRAPEH